MGIKYMLLILNKKSLDISYNLYGLERNCTNSK